MPDISETLDAPLCQDPPLIPAGGTLLHDIRDTANSKATLTIGGWVQEPGAGDYLEREFEVPHIALPLPLGQEFTDRLAATLEEVTGISMPESYEQERGRLLDTMVDAHKILSDVKTAVYGDTEMVLGITRIMTELGMRTQIVASGAANPAFAEKAKELAPGSKVMMGADFSQIAEEGPLHWKRDCQKREDTAPPGGIAQS
jgi:nitrogenase molybdenum-iron protein NifN